MPLADAAFFADAPRPITQTRLRWDTVRNFPFPDRAEYFWAREKGAAGPAAFAKGPTGPVAEIDYTQFSLYTEVAVGNFSAFFEIPYRNVDSIPDPVAGNVVNESGFADIIAGTKSLLIDCPMGQLGFQFKIFTPSGQPVRGLGTGHVSLEPALLLGLRLTRTTYLQTQWAYWIPIGGDPDYAGDIFHYHLSLNQVLWRPSEGLEFIGVAEFNGWSVLDGQFTDAAGNAIRARTNMFSMGPGIRCYVCKKIDFGLGSTFMTTDASWGDQWVRADLRWRY
jgi:hypothetical protein